MIQGYEDKILQLFEYETTAISNKKIIGTCELGKATIQLLNDTNTFSVLKGTWIKTKFGSFYIYDVKPVQEKINIKLSCYDIKYKLDTEYDSSLYVWPQTVKQWRNAIFTNCGVEYDDADFPNSDLVLEEEPNIGDAKLNRQVLCIIAQAAASWIETDSDDKFYFKWFTSNEFNIKDWSSLTTEKNSTTAINLIILGRGDVDDIVYYPKPKPDTPIEFRIDNNYILDPQDTTISEDLRETTIIPIYNQINGFKYIIYNMTTFQVDNKLSIKLGDKIKYKDIWGNELNSYVMTRKISFIGGNVDDDNNYQLTLSAEEIEETNTELKIGVDIINRVNDISIKADKNNKLIQLINSEIEETKENIASIELENNNIKSTVSSLESKTNSSLEQIEQSVTQIQTDTYTKTQIDEKLTDGSVTMLKSTIVTIDNNGQTIDKDGSPVKTNTDADGFEIIDKVHENETLLEAKYDPLLGETKVRSKHLIVEKYLTVGTHSRFEDYEDGTGIFYIS